MRIGKLGSMSACVCVLLLAALPFAHADTSDAIRGLIKTMSGPNTLTNPRLTTTPEGYLKFIAAPADNSFQSSSSAKSSGSLDAVAKSFLQEHATAFGIEKDVSFATDRVKSEAARTYVRLDQKFHGVRIFGAQAIVQMKPDLSVVSVLSDIMRDAPRVYSGQVSLTPELSAPEAKIAAAAVLEDEHPNDSFEAGAPQLFIYAPSVIGATGPARLVYAVEVYSLGPGVYAERILLDAHTGTAALRIPMVHTARFRTIYDANNVPGVSPGALKRSEGDPATNITDVDNAYDGYGDTYDFYFTNHGRDSIDNAGLTLDATVRYCPDVFNCPYFNANWVDGLNRMYFGNGFAVDDVIGHELTHGVTSHESGLIYYAESGALNESFSDVWGEFIDQTNGRGTDTPEVKWLIGEDIPSIGALRNMKNPHEFFNPDIYLGQYWEFDPNSDFGGVHTNSGVSNKFCFLLTDGENFNGFTVDPMGIPTVADLYYECQTNLLGPGSDYADFGDQMLVAAVNLGLTQNEISNVANALYATEIKKLDYSPLRDFRATGKSGDNRVVLTWRNPTLGDFTGVDIVRNTGTFPSNNTDGIVIASITNGNESYIDSPAGGAGTDVYYGIFPRPGTFVGNAALFARGTIGVDVDFLSESFANGTDLAYSQITFVPAGPVALTGPAIERPEDYFNYTTYAAHGASQSKIAPAFDGTLPVTKVDIIDMPMSDDGTVNFSTPVPVPFFGRLISNFVLSANGFIAEAADQYLTQDINSTVTLESHFKIPRISFFYSDLDPRSGGQVWARMLDDRVAITFENVPSFDTDALGEVGHDYTNTVQCELFYGGQIRFTYLNLTAQRAVVGLSDGNGVPPRIDDVLAGNPPGPAISDLTSLPSSIPLELQPVPIKYVEPGSVVKIPLSATSTVGPPLYGKIDPSDDLGIAPMSGASLNAQTGELIWNSAGFADGAYGLIVCASAGQYSSCQTIAVFLVSSTVLPAVTDVSITPESPRDSDSLVAHYTYVHPSLPEGPSVIYWFKNNVIIPAYTNQMSLPASATKAGDPWYIQVLPTTVSVGTFLGQPVYLRGGPVLSDAVTIQPDVKVDTNGDGRVNSVDLQLVVRGLLGTPQANTDPDVNGDGKEDVSDVQTTVNYILDKH